MSYAIVVLLLGVLILVHEAGHFLAARSVGIPVARFSIGFGPRVYSWHRGETEVRIALIPVGGYVLPAIQDEEAYFRIPANKRILFALGGPVANLLFPLFLLSVLIPLQSGLSLVTVFVEPLLQILNMLRQILATLPALFLHPDQLSGVVGIVAQGGHLVGSDILRMCRFSIFLSINLAVLNLLPFPVLDGGKILLCILEKIHPKLMKLNLPLHLAGWIVLVGLMVYVTIQDVIRLAA